MIRWLFPFRRRLIQARFTLRLRFHRTHDWRRSFDVNVCRVCGLIEGAA